MQDLVSLAVTVSLTCSSHSETRRKTLLTKGKKSRMAIMFLRDKNLKEGDSVTKQTLAQIGEEVTTYQPRGKTNDEKEGTQKSCGKDVDRKGRNTESVQG